MRDGFLHDARGLHHLRQEHFTAAEKVADDIHAVHQRTFDDLDRTAAIGVACLPRFLGIFDDIGVDALDQRMFEPLLDRPAAPFLLGFFFGCALALIAFGKVDQPLGRIRTAAQHHVFAGFAKLGVDVVIDIELARIDDRHVEPGRDCVIEEHRVHRTAHGLVPAEAEAEVR